MLIVAKHKFMSSAPDSKNAEQSEYNYQHRNRYHLLIISFKPHLILQGGDYVSF